MAEDTNVTAEQMSQRSLKLDAENFLIKLKEAWTKESLCDYTLIANQKHFKLHKLVLASSSLYFETKFNTLFDDAKKNVEEMPSDRVSATGLEEILNCMYTQTLHLREDNVIDVYRVAHYLQMDDIVKHCEEYMIKTVTDDSCLKYFKVAEVYSCQPLVQAMEKYLLEHYNCTANLKEFVELSAEFVVHYVSSPKLKCPEYELFQAAVKWLKHETKSESRKKEIVNLMKNIRFGIMTTRELVEGVGSEPMIMNSSDCYKMWLQAVSYQTMEHMYEQPFFCETWNQPRCEGVYLLVLSRTDMQYTSSRKMVGLSVQAQQGKALGSMVSVESHFTELLASRYGYSSSVQINNFLFVIGGIYITKGANSVMLQEAKNFVWRYNGMKGTCKAMAPLLKPRAYHASFCINENIYVVGGGLSTKQSYLSTVEMYHVRKNSWSCKANLPIAVRSPAGCTYNGRGFVSGGEKKQKANNPVLSSSYAVLTRQFLEYMPDFNEWQERTPMLTARSSHSMTGCGNRIYVFGGCEPSNALEMYNPITYQWTLLQAPTIPHVRHPVLVVHSEDLMVVGGHYPLSGDWEFSNEILRYGTKSNLWKSSLRLCFNIVDATVALMKLTI